MQRSYRLLVLLAVAVFLVYKLVTVNGGYKMPTGPSSWSKAHPESEQDKDKHKEVIAGKTPVHDSVSEHKVAENALDALPGAKPVTVPDTSLIPTIVPPKRVLANATFVTLARNGDLKEIIKSIRNVEDRFNRKYHYPWTFLNDVPFDDEFKRVTTAMCSGPVEYGVIPDDHWGMPDFINSTRAAEVRKEMGEKKIIYGDSESYRYMCRYESGFFYRHPLMMKYEYYWRVEPSIEMYCDFDYDPFMFMKENNKVYGFVISLYEYIETIPSLWTETKKFMKKFPELIPENNLIDWLSDDNGETYNRCHFWSNFEIAKLDFWRKGPYAEYFDHLDQSGGFFYERWGDAPVHSIGAGLFANKSQIHFFHDMGYYHVPFTHCPVDPKFREKCHCDVQESFDWRGYSCTGKFHDVMKLDKPKNYKDFEG